MRGERKGSALLEVVAALTILGTAAVSAVALVTESVRAVGLAYAAETEVRAASAFLDAVALWPRGDLDRRLGDRAQGPWRLRIDRPVPNLYAIALRDSLTGRVLLRTSVFRPEADDDEP